MANRGLSAEDALRQARALMSRVRSGFDTWRLSKLGFDRASVAELESDERMTLSKWLAPARADLVTGALLLVVIGIPLGSAVYLDLVEAADPRPGAAPVFIWLERHSAMLYAALFLLIVTILVAVGVQALAERLGDPDRSLGLTCRRLLKAVRQGPALDRRRLIIRNSAVLVRRASRAGLHKDALNALVTAAGKESADPSTLVRALLRDHVRGLHQDTAVLFEAGVTRRVSNRARRGLDSAAGIAVLGATATVLAALLGRI